MTVEEYERIPNPPGGRYELHHGELVFVTHPVRQHKDIQRRLRKFLEQIASGFVVDTEYPYRPLPENEVWGADVACVREERHRAVEKWLEGSPELVIEVKSPSNTKAELHDKAMTTSSIRRRSPSRYIAKREWRCTVRVTLCFCRWLRVP